MGYVLGVHALSNFVKYMKLLFVMNTRVKPTTIPSIVQFCCAVFTERAARFTRSVLKSHSISFDLGVVALGVVVVLGDGVGLAEVVVLVDVLEGVVLLFLRGFFVVGGKFLSALFVLEGALVVIDSLGRCLIRFRLRRRRRFNKV